MDHRISDYDASYRQSIRFNSNISRVISTSQSAYRIPTQNSSRIQNLDSSNQVSNTRNGPLNGSSNLSVALHQNLSAPKTFQGFKRPISSIAVTTSESKTRKLLLVKQASLFSRSIKNNTEKDSLLLTSIKAL